MSTKIKQAIKETKVELKAAKQNKMAAKKSLAQANKDFIADPVPAVKKTATAAMSAYGKCDKAVLKAAAKLEKLNAKLEVK